MANSTPASASLRSRAILSLIHEAVTDASSPLKRHLEFFGIWRNPGGTNV